MSVSEKVSTFKIFVGNVPTGSSSEDVRKIFEEYGTVVECDCLGNHAFVHMEDDIEGKHAIEELQNRELNGKVLTIQESTHHGKPQIPTVKLSVKNVSPSVDARGVRNMFKKFGLVMEVDLQNGNAVVSLEATGDIRSAIQEMNGYKIDDVALSVEPAPVAPGPESYSPTVNKIKSPIKGKSDFGMNGKKPWSNINRQPGPSYYQQDTYDFSGPGNWHNVGERFHPYQAQNHAPPERILRDPQSHSHSFQPRFPGSGPRFGKPMSLRGSRGFGGRMSGGPGMFPRGQFGGPPVQRQFNRNSNIEPLFHNRGDILSQGVPDDFSQDVFYEDDPIPSFVGRSGFQAPRMQGVNNMPLGGYSRGGGGPPIHRAPKPLMQNFPRPGGNRGGFNKGFVKPKFTALTNEVSPGEKYPVPPPHNPNFRAPQKWGKDGPKRKTKKIKKPLVPAELPDYSTPVPDLPPQTLPKGAVLKPFPTPFQSTRCGNSSLMQEYSNNPSLGQGNKNQTIDFTADDLI